LWSLGLRMVKWCEERELFVTIQLSGKRFKDSKRVYDLEFQPRSYKVIHAFLKTFPEIGKMERKQWNADSSNGKLEYNGRIESKSKTVLRIHGYAVSELPPSCRVVYEEEHVPEELVEGHTKGGYTVKKAIVVCDNGE